MSDARPVESRARRRYGQWCRVAPHDRDELAQRVAAGESVASIYRAMEPRLGGITLRGVAAEATRIRRALGLVRRNISSISAIERAKLIGATVAEMCHFAWGNKQAIAVLRSALAALERRGTHQPADAAARLAAPAARTGSGDEPSRADEGGAGS